MTCKKILFTGPPGCGKSTLIEIIIERIETPATGFFPLEIREKGQNTDKDILQLEPSTKSLLKVVKEFVQ